MKSWKKLALFFISLLAIPASFAATPEDINYSINLEWVYRAITPKERYVFPERYENEDLQKVLRAWAELNPNAAINLWYYSNNTTPEQIENTKDLFEAWNLDMKRDEPNLIKLRDFKKEIPEI